MSSSMDAEDVPTASTSSSSPSKYALSGKIMLTAIIVLFFVVILMIILHLYARWYLLRARRRHLRRRVRTHRTAHHLVFYMDTTTIAPSNSVPGNSTHGLDPDVLKRIPVFTYKKNTDLQADDEENGTTSVVECAVCLCEFEENEKGRLLPKCGHVFHSECIDMWFHSHSTCPLCRNSVELDSLPEEEVDECRGGIGPSGESSSSTPSLKLEIPVRSSSDGVEPDGFRSPLRRVLSFRSFLSGDGRRFGSRDGVVVEEVDIEVGR